MNRNLFKVGIPLTILAILSLFFIPANRSQQALSCTGPVNDKTISKGYDPSARQGEFMGKVVSVPSIDFKQTAQVLGDASDKRIEVDLARQRVYAYEGNTRVYEFIISSGKWYPTPTGTFWIARKVTAQKMSGGSRALGTYYYLPNVPWVMFFGNKKIPWTRGFSFHGTYWHNNFGQPMSHGCVNMKIPDAYALFRWAPIGTKVIIY